MKKVYLLTGKVFCGRCGCKMYGDSKSSSKGKPKYYFYRCIGRRDNKDCMQKEIRKEILEEAILGGIDELLKDDGSTTELASKLYLAYKRVSDTAKRDIEQVTDRRSEMMRKRRNLINSLAEHGHNTAIAEEVDELSVEIAESYDLENALESQTEHRDYERIRNKVEQGKRIREMTPEEQKEFLKKVIDRVVVYPDEVEINFMFEYVLDVELEH